MRVITRHPEIVSAAQHQGVELNKVFGRLEAVYPDTVRAPYPLVSLSDGLIPMEGESIVYSQGRIAAARFLSEIHGHEEVVQELEGLVI